MKIIALLVLSSCTALIAQDKPCTSTGPACDSRAQLAVDYMHGRFGDADNSTVMVIENDYSATSRIRLERRESQFEKLEKWANTLAEPDRSAYLGVINFYEDGARDAYREWHTHDAKNQQDAYEKHERECKAAARRSNAVKPMPLPPVSVMKY